jgi:hypothetical protein
VQLQGQQTPLLLLLLLLLPLPLPLLLGEVPPRYLGLAPAPGAVAWAVLLLQRLLLQAYCVAAVHAGLLLMP